MNEWYVWYGVFFLLLFSQTEICLTLPPSEVIIFDGVNKYIIKLLIQSVSVLIRRHDIMQDAGYKDE